MLSRTFAGHLLLFAREVVNEQKRRLSVPYPPASNRREYPRRRTGNFRRSVVARPLSVSEIQRSGKVAVGVLGRAFYGVILELDRDRLGFAETVADVIRGKVKGGRLPAEVKWTRSRATIPG